MGCKRFSSDQEIEICRIYFEDQLSIHRLAKQFECSHSTISDLIKRNGFKLRSISEAGRGKLNSHWKGGRTHHERGYVLIYNPSHPHCDRYGYVREHRLVMEKHLGRFLEPDEIVHHKNKIKNDNRPENLMLFGGYSQHAQWHKKIKKETNSLQKDFCVNPYQSAEPPRMPYPETKKEK